jgi:lauroyl/myristoyl acyltransferase
VTDIGYILAATAARHMPYWMSDCLAVAVADLCILSRPARARAVDRRLRRVWAESGSVGPVPTARETHRAFARGLRDFLAADARARTIPRVRLDEEARAILRDARASGRSTVLVSAHFGPWEVALQWLAREVGPVDALAQVHRLSAVERFFAARRAACGVRTLSAGRPASAALARLRAGGWIAALADRGARRRPHAPRGEGHPDGSGLVRVDPAPLLLARRASAQVLAGVAWGAPDGAVEVRFQPAFSLEPCGGGLALPQAEARLQRFFDAHVRAHPTQWFDWSPWPAAGSAGPAGESSEG